MIFPKNIKYYKLLYIGPDTNILKITQDRIDLEYLDKKYTIAFHDLIGIIIDKSSKLELVELITMSSSKTPIYIINNKQGIVTIIDQQPNPKIVAKQVILDKLAYSKLLIKNKITNQLTYSKINKTISAKQFDAMDKLHQIMLFEGRISTLYFKSKFYEYGWSSREPRQRNDRINLLLDISYHHLYLLVNTLIISYSILPNLGILHTDEENKNSLSLDLMEVFRVDMDQVVVNYLSKNKNVKYIIKNNKTNFDNYEDNKIFQQLINAKLQQLKPKIAKYIYSYRLFLLGKGPFPIYLIK